MRIAIIQGHPDPAGGHFCHALADAYATGARGRAYEVETVPVAKLTFPLLRTKDEFEQGVPPADVKAAQDVIARCDHMLIVYPLWLGEMPAIVKGFLEQVMRPGFAYAGELARLKPQLRGKSARVIVTMGMPAAIYRWYFRAHGLESLRRNILSFVGFRPVRSTLIGSIETQSAKRRTAWLDTVAGLGAKGC